MNILNSIILGIVQGVTEFLPISSSGHLVIFEHILNYKISLADELILDIGTLIALIIFTRKDLILIIKEIINPKLLSEKNSIKFKGYKISKKLILVVLGSIPVVIAGLLFKSFLESNIASLSLIAVMMILVGILMIIAEKLSKKIKDINNLTVKDVLIIGISQIFALIRGTSRSGVTIGTGLILGYTREEAVNISFLIGIPALFGSCLIGVMDVIKQGPGQTGYLPLAIGFLASFISGIISIKILMSFIKNHRLTIFSVYRIIVGVLILVLTLLR